LLISYDLQQWTWQTQKLVWWDPEVTHGNTAILCRMQNNKWKLCKHFLKAFNLTVTEPRRMKFCVTVILGLFNNAQATLNDKLK
jgi:hypothetical protein